MNTEEPVRPGRELDALVAKHVMGLTVERENGKPVIKWSDLTLQNVPPYSNDKEAAFRVVDRLYERKLWPEITRLRDGSNQWCVRFCDYLGQVKGQGYGATLEFAICEAALLAVEYSV